jgi:hypothetical protein
MLKNACMIRFLFPWNNSSRNALDEFRISWVENTNFAYLDGVSTILGMANAFLNFIASSKHFKPYFWTPKLSLKKTKTIRVLQWHALCWLVESVLPYAGYENKNLSNWRPRLRSRWFCSLLLGIKHSVDKKKKKKKSESKRFFKYKILGLCIPFSNSSKCSLPGSLKAVLIPL